MDESGSEIKKKTQEKLLKIVSSSFYKELIKYGVNSSDIISVSMNLLDYATESTDETKVDLKKIYDFDVKNVQNNWSAKEEIRLDDVSIKRLKENQIKKIAEWLKQKEINDTYISFFPKELNELKSYLFNREDKTYFSIHYKEDNFVGIIGAERINTQFKKLEMKKFLGEKKYRGKGIAKSATFLFLYYVFELLQFNKVFIHSMDTNIKNINLNNHFGFSLEGLLSREVSLNGAFHDVIRMGLLKSKWELLFNKK
jgi:RimJ/RimL family protein N-acetyltransferase